jgi:hypothetical protein
MFHKHANKPEDAIAQLLEKYHYDAAKFEAFVDASATYTTLTSPTLQQRITPDAVERAKHRARYHAEFDSASAFLEGCKLEKREASVLSMAKKSISTLFQERAGKSPEPE